MNFIPGLKLNKAFYFEVIKPLLNKKFPDLKYSAAFIGYGSDVLGVDDKISMDHNWGPRCTLFLSSDDYYLKDEIDDYLKNSLPFEFRGFPTNYTDPRVDFTQQMKLTDIHPINHLVEISEIESYFKHHLSIEDLNNITETNWLNFKDQVIIELISGEVYHDGLNKLNSIRKNFNFYPLNVQKIKLASLWFSIWNEEPFIGRCIEMNDVLGLKLITSRIVSSLMKILCYLENRYITYSKWFGTIFKDSRCYNEVSELITEVLMENSPELIQDKLCKLYELVILIHNRSKQLPHIDNKIRNFFDRPYKVIFAETIVETLMDSVDNKKLKDINLNLVSLDIKLESIDFTE